MTQWEYDLVWLPSWPKTSDELDNYAKQCKAQLNKLGEQGWEVVTTLGGMLLVKRSKVSSYHSMATVPLDSLGICDPLHPANRK